MIDDKQLSNVMYILTGCYGTEIGMLMLCQPYWSEAGTIISFVKAIAIVVGSISLLSYIKTKPPIQPHSGVCRRKPKPNALLAACAYCGYSAAFLNNAFSDIIKALENQGLRGIIPAFTMGPVALVLAFACIPLAIFIFSTFMTQVVVLQKKTAEAFFENSIILFIGFLLAVIAPYLVLKFVL